MERLDINIMSKTNAGGMGNEPFYHSRRFYGAVAGLAGIVLGSFGFDGLSQALVAAAVALTGWSWAKPGK